jgi:phosphatidate cytidylyltransferase
MLLQRVITALVLLAILLPALFYPSTVPFTLVVLALMAAGAWEWGRLSGPCGQAGSLAVGRSLRLPCVERRGRLGWIDQPLTALWIVGGGLWVLGAAWLLHAGVPGWARIPAALRLVAGVLALWLAWLAVVQARHLGVNFLLSVLVAGVGGRHFCLFRRPCFWLAVHQEQAGALHQSRQELGRCMGRAGGRGCAGICSGQPQMPTGKPLCPVSTAVWHSRVDGCW